MPSIIISSKSKNDLQLLITMAERMNCTVNDVPETASKLIEGKNLFDSVSKVLKENDPLGLFKPLKLNLSSAPKAPVKKVAKKKRR